MIAMYCGCVLQDVSLWSQVSPNCTLPRSLSVGESAGNHFVLDPFYLFFTDTKTMKTRKHNTAVSRSAVIKFRCSVGEKKIIGQQAAASGKNLSEFCRGQALHGKIYAARKLSSEEKQYFILLKSHNLGFTRITNLIKARDPELYREIRVFLAESKALYNRFF